MFDDIVRTITSVADEDFERASAIVIDAVDNDVVFLDTLKQIGTIPEFIEHDSTEEKLFSKASDAVLARAFRELGLHSLVLKERADSADVLAESPLYGYSLVADAKAFRMSRTAKNQKDFKVTALSGWRQDCDFAVLCAPYFQYPSSASQIYAQALEHDVCLLGWEHLIFLIENGVRESGGNNLAAIWQFSGTHSHSVSVAERKRCFIHALDAAIVGVSGKPETEFEQAMARQRRAIHHRAEQEIDFWRSEIESIRQYSREQAIAELIKARKINEKIGQIAAYAGRLAI